MSALNRLREEVAATLEEAGLRAVSYTETRIVPPIAIVQPSDPYILAAESGRNTFGEVTVGIQVLLLAGKGTDKVAAEAIDNMIETAIFALEGADVTQVTAPGMVDLKGTMHFGAIVSIEATLRMKEE